MSLVMKMGIRQQAIDEAKKGGDGAKATALAIIYLADVLERVGK